MKKNLSFDSKHYCKVSSLKAESLEQYDIDLEDALCCLVQFLPKNEKKLPQSLPIFLQSQNRLKIFVPKFDQIWYSLMSIRQNYNFDMSATI